MAEHHLLDHAGRQHGVFTRADAREHGLSKRQIDYRLERRRWVRIAGGVYRLAGAPATWQGRLVAACLAGGPSAAASHRAAARLWGLHGFDDPIVEITMPRGRSHRIAGVKVHECCLPLHDSQRVVDGVPVVAPEVMLIQLASLFGARGIEGLVDEVLRRQLTTIPALHRTLDVVGRSGRDGSGILRRALDLREPRHTGTESKLERAFVDLIATSPLSAPRLQHAILDQRGVVVARVDAAWPEAHLAVELDGRAFHEPLDRWNRDLARQNAIVMAGWTPLRFTWWDVHHAPGRVIRDITRFLRAAA